MDKLTAYKKTIALKERYYSLDVFRGATVALMILVNNPGSWSHIYGPLKHAPWHGWTPTDLVFPFFLFAVGNAMAFTMPALQAAGPTAFWKKVTRRFLLIFVIGVLLNWAPFVRWEGTTLVFKEWISSTNSEQGIRILGVLQRIALAYFFAALLIFYLSPRILFYVSCLLLIGYWVLLLATGNPADPFSLTGFVGTQVDIDVLGVAHVYKGEGVPFDPEGLVSTITSIVQVIFGYFTGVYVRQRGKTYEMLSHLLLAGVIFIVGAYIWDALLPINKKIWTSSYVMLTTGLAMVCLAVFIYLLEFKKAEGAWSSFFNVFGKNPLFIFVLSGLLPRLVGLLRWRWGTNPDGSPDYTSPFDWFYNSICDPISSDPRNGSLLYALVMIGMYWFIGWLLHRRKIYVKV